MIIFKTLQFTRLRLTQDAVHQQQREARVQHEVDGLGGLGDSGQGLQVGWCEGYDAGVLQDEPPLHCTGRALHTFLHVVCPSGSNFCLSVFSVMNENEMR